MEEESFAMKKKMEEEKSSLSSENAVVTNWNRLNC